MEFSNDSTLVFDTGSRFTKAGFAGEHFPRVQTPTVLGCFRHAGILDAMPDMFFGHEAIQKRGISNLSWPVEDGFIKKWDDVEKIWFNIFFKELRVPPEQSRILHAIHPLAQKGDREKMAEILFESFSIKALNLVKSPALTLYASGRTTGVVYENGASSSFVCPIFEGFPLIQTTTSCLLTGEALTKRLITLLSELGYKFTTPCEIDIVNDIKAKLCYVTHNYKEECENYQAGGKNQENYDLPDGQRIFIGADRFKVPEILFQPKLAGLDCPNICEYITGAVEKNDIDIRPELYENIVISGGSTLFPGFASRLIFELTQKVKRMPVVSSKINIDKLPQRDIVPWIGGSLLASMEGLKGFWMTRQEFEDIGPDRVNYKFF